MRRKDPSDISKPLKNSFIHTGHGDPYGESWGSPAEIDEVYLRNPMDPPDLLGLTSESTGSPQTPIIPERKRSKMIWIKKERDFICDNYCLSFIYSPDVRFIQCCTLYTT